MKINTLNTLSQNNPAFGVRIPINEVTISDLQLRQRLIAKHHQLAKPVKGSILGIIYDYIMNTTQENSYLISFLQTTVSKAKKLRNRLKKSKITLERAFWETCNKFFDVQLVANDEDKNKNIISDAKIKEDSYLIRIFHPIKNIEEKRKQIIEYCIKNYSEAKAKNKRFAFCKEVKNELNPDMEAKSIQISILGPVLRLPEHYNEFKKNAIQGKEQTFTEFKEYLKEKATPNDNKNFYSNGKVLAYTIETFKKYVPEFKEEFVFAKETQAKNNSTIANTIGKERKKSPSKEQSYKDAVSFINYYIGENIINLNLTSKEIHSTLFNKTNENHVSLGALKNWRTALNLIKETLEKYPNKTDADIMNVIKNEYHSNRNCFLPNDKLIWDAIKKLRDLNKITKDNIVETSDIDSDYIDSDTLQTKTDTQASIKSTHKPNIAKKTKINDTFNTDIGNRNRTKNSKLASYIDSDSNYSDSDYIDSDTLQANINTQASIKRMHVTKPLDIDKTYSKDDSLKENECEVFNTKDTPDEINMFETKRQHVIPNQDAPILPNLSNKTVIPMPQAMDNDNKNIKEKNGWQSNYDELPPLTSLEYDTFYETSYLSNIPQFINNNDFFTDLENLSPVQPSNTNASTSFDNIDIDKVSSNKNLLPNSNNQIGLSSENSSSGNINAEFF